MGSDKSNPGLAVVIRNISDRIQAEAELRRASEELHTKNEALGEHDPADVPGAAHYGREPSWRR